MIDLNCTKFHFSQCIWQGTYTLRDVKTTTVSMHYLSTLGTGLTIDLKKCSSTWSEFFLPKL